MVSFAGAGVSGAEDSFGKGVTAVGDLEAIAGESGRQVGLWVGLRGGCEK